MEKTKAVDAKAYADLGIGHVALSLLLDADPNVYQRKSKLAPGEKWPRLQNLEARGYITIATSEGLPDGQEAGETFIRYVATEKGKAVVSALTKAEKQRQGATVV